MTVVVDAVALDTRSLERLEVEVSLDASTTVGAVVEDVLESLKEMHLEALGEPADMVLLWCESGAYRQRLPPPTGEAAVWEAYKELLAESVDDAATPLYSYAHDRKRAILDTPRIRLRLTTGAAPLEQRHPAYMLLIPVASVARAAVMPPPPPPPPPLPTPRAASTASVADGHEERGQASWVERLLLKRPPSSFSDNRLLPFTEEQRSESGEVGAREWLAARQLVERAIAAALRSPSLACVFPEDGAVGGRQLRSAWLARCDEEAAAYGRETQRLEASIAQRAAWRAASVRKLREEVAVLEADAEKGRALRARTAKLEERLAGLRAQSDVVRREEAVLLSRLQPQRVSPSPLPTRRANLSSEDGPSPIPLPPDAPPPSLRRAQLSGEEQSLRHFLDNAEGEEGASVDADVPNASTLRRLPARVDERGDAAVGRRDREEDRSQQTDAPASPDGAPPAAAVLHRAGDADTDADAVTRLSFNTSGLAPAPHGEAWEGDEQRSFFFSPSLRAQVEEALARSGGARAPPPPPPRPPSRQRPSGIRVMSIRQDSRSQESHE